ncbi:N-acetyl-gamma-glutamyl-phosphate reductase [Portibacter lacus]|uniref:N-acetyl-gamma-glutamyl-phosphate reductase n=1 Tax=Portibacter lacus TaxID=1099794 RepID=A0AA37SP91_9BACT|nr:N-acetyl-gamma-glutamyl-phosphate reductase [Portibacter lacus]GLR17545.1 N-acetyl-gamma-glutamyl-phosphate reductase [Portibacter lacus]
MINVGVVGGTGFTGGELLRILSGHPETKLNWVYSRTYAGKPLHSAHDDLEGIWDLAFVDKCDWNVDVVFLCLPHETAKNFVESEHIPEGVKIIDLSRDYRFNEEGGFIYGLPELNKEKIKKASKIANPGCFATSIQLALLPLAFHKVLNHDVQVTGVTGSTGAGKGLSATTHFTWRTSNASVYKALKHQHIQEIFQSVHQLQPSFEKRINFVPMRGNFTRGILASIYTDTTWTAEEALSNYQAYYADHPFVRVTNQPIDMKQVVNTNLVRISVNVIDGQIHLVSVIDNLTKGASGQAVQNMNLVFGLDEKTGLNLKSIGY